MSSISLREMQVADLPDIVILNEHVVAVTSPLDDAGAKRLFHLASHRYVAQDRKSIVAFLFALAQSADYDNANFAWFREHCDNFVYVDRIVVDVSSRRQRIGERLYAKLIDDVIGNGSESASPALICAEIDLLPPNQASLQFHQRLGFEQIGTRTSDTGKQLSMQRKRLVD